MTDKLNLVDDHRAVWVKLLGQRKTFRGTVKRFGHKHRQGADIKRGATLVLTDVHQTHSKNSVDHAWIDYTAELGKFGEHIRPKAIIEFTAIVGAYQKGGKNAYGKVTGTYDDLELSDIKDVRIVKEPYLPKSYGAIVDDEFVSMVIAKRENLKQGIAIGSDPRGQLGTIRIGNGFCNRFAKTLSWRWINLLPEKYGGGLAKD